MKNKNVFSFFIIIIFLIVGFFLVSQGARIYRPTNIKIVTIAGQNIFVDVATQEGQREQGLSGRANLKEDEGMLFVFEFPGKYSFWMKDMNFPIDIIWLGEDLQIVYIKKDALPELYLPAGQTLETYGPDRDAKYVLEVSAGFSEKNNLQVGDRVEFAY